jgi:CheY-like chemotaxis protein
MRRPRARESFAATLPPAALPNESQSAGQVGFHLHELRTAEDRLGFRADRSAPLMENPEQAGRAAALIREVGDAAMQSVDASRTAPGALLLLGLGLCVRYRDLSIPWSSLTLDVDAEAETTPEGPTPRVLLLEDRDDFRSVLHDYLVSRSYQVTSVRNGVEGLREITKDTFDLILCDMMMPQGGGEMFYWAVTRVRSGAGRRFIFFTGHQKNPAIEFFFQRVNATVLIKPFKLAALDSAISDVFRKLA